MKIGKLLTIFGLALLLVSIAYIRSLKSHQDYSPTISPEASSSVPTDLLNGFTEKEQTERQLDSICRLYSDSLEKMKQAWSALADSQYQAKAESLDQVIDGLTEKLDLAEKSASEAKKEKTAQFERLVAAFYKGEVAQLPADLSEYERGVSINEIRDKAERYFGVSSKTLNRILKTYQ